MPGLSEDPDVERFLNNFSQLDKTRNEENDIRFKSLEKQLEEKKKQYELSPLKNKKLPPIVPSKSSNLNKLIPPKKNENDDLTIPLFNPVASNKNEHSTPQTQTISIDLNHTYTESPTSRKNEPKPIKLEDVLQLSPRTDIRGFKSYSHTTNTKPEVVQKSPPAVASKPIQLTSTPNTTSNHSITKAWVPMPSKLNAISAAAAAKAPQLMKTKVDSSAGDKFWEDKEEVTVASPERTKPTFSASPVRSGPYIPMPSKLNVLSATAAAKAPQLMKNKVDSSAGERLWEDKTRDKNPKDYDVVKPFLPMPSKINAFSAAAAAKAKPLAQTKIETSLSDKTSDIDMTYKYLTRNGDAFKDSVKEKVKPQLPARKPDLKVAKKPAFTEEDTKTDAYKKLNSLKPARPIVKEPEAENEALLKLRQLKNKSSRMEPISSIKRNIPYSSSSLSSSSSSLSSSKEISDSSSIPAPATRMSTVSTNKQKVVAIALPGLANRDELNSLLKTKSLSNTPFDSRNSSTTDILSRSRTLDNSDLNGNQSNQKLNHVTKSRAKGPKRRLPKSVGNSPATTPNSTIVEAPPQKQKIELYSESSTAKPKKIPPPIKKPSRVVSNSAIFI